MPRKWLRKSLSLWAKPRDQSVSGFKPPAGPPGLGRVGKGAAKLKKLGIVGGSSWASTALYYEHLNRGIAHRLGGLHSALLAIESLDLAPFAAMQQSGDWDGVASIAVEAARRLKASGAEGLLLASATMHKVEGAVAAEARLPILHIADAGVEQL